MKRKGISGRRKGKYKVSELYKGMACPRNDEKFAGAGAWELGYGRSGS